jgi:outer membrane protein OmpA-like peptidoglycan-associated protein
MKSLLVLLLIGSSAFSQSTAPLHNATAAELLEKLAPTNSPMTRSLGGRNLVPQAKSVDLVIRFDLDSAQLQEPSKPLLDNLITAMKSDRLSQFKFKIEGHTDAQGSQAYNLRLSQSRAQSVATYLSAQGIDPQRLGVEGKGFSELLLPQKPNAAENRRVKITALP